jgi:hypothetical protein
VSVPFINHLSGEYQFSNRFAAGTFTGSSVIAALSVRLLNQGPFERPNAVFRM